MDWVIDTLTIKRLKEKGDYEIEEKGYRCFREKE